VIYEKSYQQAISAKLAKQNCGGGHSPGTEAEFTRLFRLMALNIGIS